MIQKCSIWNSTGDQGTTDRARQRWTPSTERNLRLAPCAISRKAGDCMVDPSVQGKHFNSSSSISSSRVSYQSVDTVPLSQVWDHASWQRHSRSTWLGQGLGPKSLPHWEVWELSFWQHASVCHLAPPKSIHNYSRADCGQAVCYLFQLLLNHTLLLGDMLELLGVLLWELSPSLFGGTLLSWKGLLGFPVCADLFFKIFLLHLKKLLGLLKPFFVLFTLWIIWGKKLKFICVNFLKSSVQDTQIHFVREQFHHDLVIGILKT